MAFTRLTSPAFIRADWTFWRTGKVVLRKLPLYLSKKGSFPTATYLPILTVRCSGKRIFIPGRQMEVVLHSSYNY